MIPKCVIIDLVHCVISRTTKLFENYELQEREIEVLFNPFPFHCRARASSAKRIYLCIAQPLINVSHGTMISGTNDSVRVRCTVKASCK